MHGFIDRRGSPIAPSYAVGGLTAAGILELMNPKFAEAQLVPNDDKRIKAEWVEIDSPKGNGKIKAYVVKPANATGKLPTVLVIHENRGLNPHIEDVARRLALDGLPGGGARCADAAWRLPEGRRRQGTRAVPETGSDQDAGRLHRRHQLRAHATDSNGKIGAVGFCYGGGMLSFLATRVPELAAGVSFYGVRPRRRTSRTSRPRC